MRDTFTRRGFIRVTAGASGALAVGPTLLGCGGEEGSPPIDPLPTWRPTGVAEDLEAFPLGVQATDPDPDSAMLWTRVDLGRLRERRIDLILFRPDDPNGDVVRGGAVLHQETLVPDEIGFLPVLIDGLSPGKAYGFAFALFSEGIGRSVGRSTVGRFRTRPKEEDQGPVRIGVSCCSNSDYLPWDALTRAAEESLDFHILLGDTVYAEERKTLEGYRSEWSNSYGEEPYRDLRASTAIFATWDDHEVGNNWVAVDEEDPEQPRGIGASDLIGPTRLEAARQVFREHTGIRSPADHPERIWRSFRWGAHLEVFILDCRGERDFDNGLYISRAQMDWLKEGLAASTATWKLVMNSVPIADLPAIFGIAVGDRWEAIPGAREEILDFIDAEVTNVLWVSGDLHFAGFCLVGGANRGRWHGQHEVVVGHVGSLPNTAGELMTTLSPDQWLAGSTAQGYALLELDPVARPGELRIRYVSDKGRDIFSHTMTAS
jgi:alkaline phosphatase D